MPPGEILWRLSRALRDPGRRLAASRRLAFEPRFTSAGDAGARSREAVAAAARLLIPDPDRARRRYAELFPTGRQRSLEAAEGALAHRFDFFARSGIDLGSEIDWHKDPLTGGRWPLEYAGSINLRDGERIGEVRTVWELNRHHHLVALARAAFLERDERFADEVVRQWSGWLEANPPLAGVNWASPLEIAIRLLNWSWCLAFLHGTKALEAASLERLLGAYQEQASEVAANLSRFSSANNHLIGEAAGLAVAGTLYPGLDGAARWRATGLEVLEREAMRQIHDDGVGKEQAPHYLAFVIDFYAAAAVAAHPGERFPSAAAAERIGRAAEFLALLRNEANELPAIGDSDEGRAIGLFAPGEDPFVPAIREGAHLAGRSDLAGGVPLSEQAYWILGEEAARVADSPRRTPRVFRSGGYAVFRWPPGPRSNETEIVALLDAGDLGYLSLAAHGHADALALAVSVAGRWLLADPGTYCYHRSWPWRRHFKGTAAHNTIVIDGRDQSEILGPSLWGRRARARLRRWVEGDGFWSAEAEHDGYASLTDPVIHGRQVVFVPPDLFVVVDRLEGRGEHLVAAHFQAAAGVSVAAREDGAVLFSAGGSSVLLLRAAPPVENVPWSARIVSGRESPPLGWTAPRFGARVATPAVEFAGRFRMPCAFAWLLRAGSAAGGDEVALQADGSVLAGHGARALAIAPDGAVRLAAESAVP